jgi:acyl-CoA synthetase (AMP-forming)/AMP-acid ligase II
MSRPHRLRCLAGLAILGCLLGGCVPVPFRPSATVSHEAVTSLDEAPRVESATDRTEAAAVAKAIRRDEPRVVLVNPPALSDLIAASVTLRQVLDAAHQGNAALPADYILSVGIPSVRQLHDTGAAAPVFFMPAVVGYEKIQSQEVVPAMLLDLRDPQTLQLLCASSTYSEVATGLVYGVMTIAMPEAALRESLAREVAHTLAVAQPEGTIRLLVLMEHSGLPTHNAFTIPYGCDATPPLNTVTAAAVH